MREFSKNQIDYIVQKYFAPHERARPGSTEIGYKLLKQGSVIVAGNTNFLVGGIVNFVETKRAENFVGCMEYSLNYTALLSNKAFQRKKQNVIYDLKEKVEIMEQRIKELEALTK
jgi:hypothetical protein